MLAVRLEFVMVVMSVVEVPLVHQKKRSQCLKVAVKQMQLLKVVAAELALDLMPPY